MHARTYLRRLKRAGESGVSEINRRLYRRTLPHLDTRDRCIVDALEREGAYLTHLDQLQVEGGEEILRLAWEAFELWKSSPRVPAGKSYIAALPDDAIEERPAMFAWGLHERLLAIAEHYIGRPIFYRGLAARCDLADGQSCETRQFHLDYEDQRILKIIVYLNDVGEDGGPFEYIPRKREPWADRLRFTDGRVLDADMAPIVPQRFWKKCTGRAGTVLFADPCSIWHRGREPITGDRFALFYAYNSKTPRVASMAGPMLDFDALMPHLRLSPYQASALSLGPT